MTIEDGSEAVSQGERPSTSNATNAVVVTNDEPTAHDSLGRDIQLLGLSSVVMTANPPLVVGVHGEWGEGKTSFMSVLKRLLSKRGRASYQREDERRHCQNSVATRFEKELGSGVDLPTVWFNAWRYQFEDEPVLPLLDAIRNQVPPSAWGKLKSTVKLVVEDPRLRVVGKAALGVGKLVGPGWVSALAPSGFLRVVDKRLVKQVLRDFAQLNNELRDCFRVLLKNYPTENGERPDRIVIFIDDLDRCEAPYVVKIMESLKLHLLNEHCVFVLGCATSHVRDSLISQGLARGQEEARHYLEKIVQLPVQLPPIWDQTLADFILDLGSPVLRGSKQSLHEAFELLRSYSSGNPRRLKRFLAWFGFERSMIDMVEELNTEGAAKELLANTGVLLKVKLLQFAEPALFVQPIDFEQDKPQAYESAGESSVKAPAPTHESNKEDEDPKDKGQVGSSGVHKRGSAQRAEGRLAFKAKPPFVGQWLAGADDRDQQLLLVLALSTDAEIARARIDVLHKNRKIIDGMLGRWRGRYYQHNRKTVFTLTITEFDGQAFAGETAEKGRLGPAEVWGEYDAGAEFLVFQKKYKSEDYVIDYSGAVVSRNRVEGEWRIVKHEISDRFIMEKLED